jgi:60 kDa SS-A/Ro ribonucleoprotein
MGKFNTPRTIKQELASRPDAVQNYEGSLAYSLDPLTDLYIRAASTLVGEPKYYESAEDADSELLKAIQKAIEVDPEFVLQLAVYCREKLYLRSVPLMLLAEFANSNAVGKVPNARKYVSRTIQRADELAELVAYQFARNKVIPRAKAKLPMMLKNGLADAFAKFDEYQLSKYNREGAVKLRDVLFLTHPKPANPERQELYNKITQDTLAIPETWEVMRSTGKMTWHDVINRVFNKDGKVFNYMAQLRNLRNCLQDSTVTQADILLLCKMLSDKNAVMHSKQFPFRFLSAYREAEKIAHPLTPQVLDALETAVSYSLENIPKLEGTTLIASDVSGSMKTAISKNSTVQRWDIGIVLGMIAHKFCQVSLTGIFGTDWKAVPLAKYSTGLLANSMELRSISNEVGWSTNGYKIIEYLLASNLQVDRIMIFTDCQMWDSSGYDKTFAELFIKYQRKYPHVKLYAFDLSGYGSIMIPQNTRGVCLIGGWSDKVFDFVKAFEELGQNTAIQKIKGIKPKSLF